MGPRKPWSEIAVYVTEAGGIDILENMKSYQIHRSDPVTCTICAYSGDHDMRYRLLKCVSTTCALAPSQACPWRGKLLVCLKTRRTTILEQEEHFSQASSPKRLRLSSAQKQFCRELTEERLRPMRIRHAVSRKFGVALDSLPSLTTVKNYVNNYSRSKLDNHDRVDDIRKWIGDRAYAGEEPMTQPFTFSWGIDMHGRPLVGDGSDENPFLVGISSKAMMFRLAAPPDSFTLHIDATYKLNRLEYPVVVVGISDQSRGFHLVALFIVSQEVQEIYESALRALDRLFTWITGQKLVVYFSMGGADQAQYNALNAVFGTHAQFKCLMCFFHVMKKVHEALRGIPVELCAKAIKDIYDLHFATNETEFAWMRENVLQSWSGQPLLKRFAAYMKAQWLYGRFSNWQVFSTASGFAITNNPVETFNSVSKRDYTMRRRLTMSTLLRELSECCHRDSGNLRPLPLYDHSGGCFGAASKGNGSWKLTTSLISAECSVHYSGRAVRCECAVVASLSRASQSDQA